MANYTINAVSRRKEAFRSGTGAAPRNPGQHPHPKHLPVRQNKEVFPWKKSSTPWSSPRSRRKHSWLLPPGVEQVFLRDSDITAADLEGATVLLGNPSVAAVREGGTSLRWRHTRQRRAPISICPKVTCPQALCSPRRVAHTGISVSEHMFAMLMALMKRLPRLPGQPER